MLYSAHGAISLEIADMKRCKHCSIELNESVYHEGLQCKTCKNGLLRYGLNRIQQKALLTLQKCRCKLCRCEVGLFVNDNQAGVIDHCHTTGKVRGILCGGCNTLIGKVERACVAIHINEYLSNIKKYLD